MFVTADHGFLFQQQALSVQDKTTLQIKPENTIKNHKRLLLEQETVIRRNKNACAVETVDYLGD
ncbi:hypothetical protein ACUOFC_43225 [Escherichia sp. TWPC-MK]